MIVFPEWWKGGYPDREKLCQYAVRPFTDLLDVYTLDPDDPDQPVQVMNADDTPRRPYLCSWLPSNYLDRLPVVRFYRGGGAVDEGKLKDPASVQIGVVGATRDDSVTLLEYTRQILLALPRSGGAVKCPDGSWSSVLDVYEIDGPELIPEVDPDARLVVHTLGVDCRMPRDVPDYGPIITRIMTAA